MFSRQKCSNFAQVCTYLYFKAHSNKMQYIQFQSNMYIEEKLTSFLHEVKFSRLHEQNLCITQNNTFPISIETLETDGKSICVFLLQMINKK